MKKALLFSAAMVLGAAFSAQAELWEGYSLSIPNTTTPYLDNCRVHEGEYWGMGNIQLNVHVEGLAINRESTAEITLSYNGTVVKTLSPAEETQINITSISAGALLADEGDENNGANDLIDPLVTSTVDFYFTAEEEEGMANKPNPEFLKTGVYVLNVPAGVLQSVTGAGDDEVVTDLPAIVITYNFTGEVEPVTGSSKFTYYFTPAANSYAADLKSIVLTVVPEDPEAKFAVNGKCTLVSTDAGLSLSSSYPKTDGYTVKWTFNKATIEGEYTFTMPANFIEVNGVKYDQPIVTIFHVGEEPAAVLPEETPTWDEVKFELPESENTTITKDEDQECFVINTTANAGEESVAIKVALPTGYNKCWVAEEAGGYNDFSTRASSTRASDSWIAADEILPAMESMGMKFEETDTINVPADNQEHLYHVMFGVDDMVNYDAKSALMAKVSTATGVDGIVIETAKAEYFNLQGVKVANPENGIFVKVVNGKAVKVVK